MTPALPDHDGGWHPGRRSVWILRVVVLAAILVGRFVLPGCRRSTSRRDAETVLAERFPRGAIDAEEYQRTLAMRRKNTGPQDRGAHR